MYHANQPAEALLYVFLGLDMSYLLLKVMKHHWTYSELIRWHF